jgi:hypothetical protein
LAATHVRADAEERLQASGGSTHRSGWINWAQQEAKPVILWSRHCAEQHPLGGLLLPIVPHC